MIAYNYTKQCAALLFLVEWGGWRGGRGWRDCTRTVCWKNQSCFMEALCAAAPFSVPVDEHTWIWTAALINMAETGWLPLRWCDVTKVLSTHETGIHDALWWACITKGGNSKTSYSTSLLCYWSVEWQGDFPVSVLNNATLPDLVNWLCEINRLKQCACFSF